MNRALLNEQFERLGARVRYAALLDTLRPGADRVQLEVLRDGEEDFFEIRTSPDRLVQLIALDVRPDRRRLLLMAVLPATHETAFDVRRLFLCGYDDRDWFVSELSELTRALDVASALDALRPVRLCAPRPGVRSAVRHSRPSDALTLLN